MLHNTEHQAPIFIHAWFRSGSTYVWSKFRQNNQLIAFYEPLHEGIQSLDPVTIRSVSSKNQARDLKHPKIENHYFYEYIDVIGDRNIFQSRLSYDEYYLSKDDDAPELTVYINSLVSGAKQDQNKRPVLCFCRSQLRSNWMTEKFPGHHIAQIRNPFDQWNSFQISSYFIDKLIRTAHSIEKRFNGLFDNVPRIAGALKMVRNYYPSQIKSYNNIVLSDRDLFNLFLVIWYISTLQATSSSEFVLDIDLLGTDAKYAKKAESYFHSIGVGLKLRDCKIPQDAIKMPNFSKLMEHSQIQLSKLQIPAELETRQQISAIRAKNLDLYGPTNALLLNLPKS